MSEENHFFCDTETGVCNVPEQEPKLADIVAPDAVHKISIIYFTDPICSSCWGIEPYLRKLKLEYGEFFSIEYRMGGLLPSWNTYAGNDVKTPKDVAVHWDEAGHYYEMPIDGNVWLEDPLSSSYPPGIAFKAAEMQDQQKAMHFLRRIKEMVFLEKKNTTKIEHLKIAAIQTGLDPEKLEQDIQGDAKIRFEADLLLARSLGIKGFPSILFTDSNAHQYLLYGFKLYEAFEEALLKWNPYAVKRPINTNYVSLFKSFPTMTTKEFAVLTHKNKAEAETFLNQLFELNRISRYESKTGYLWRLANSEIN